MVLKIYRKCCYYCMQFTVVNNAFENTNIASMHGFIEHFVYF